jgi:hypothetical protein
VKSSRKKIFEKIWTTIAIVIISGLSGKANSFGLDDEKKE